VEALLLAATKPVPPGSIFNIGSGVGVPVKEVVERLLRLMGHPVKPLLGAIPMRPDEILTTSADISSARTVLGWQPRTSLEEGLRKSIAWFTEHRELAGQLAQRPSDTARDPVGAAT
jgi:nucleoside-diphosphate-sugar epimerase